MTLWTMQPKTVHDNIIKHGQYICDSEKITMPDFRKHYDWLVTQMKQRIGCPDKTIQYPVWAWHTRNWKHKKPDLRHARWAYGKPGEAYICIELEIPDNQVLLSDFDAWNSVLNNSILADNMEDWERQEDELDKLPEPQKTEALHSNWEKNLFNISPLKNEWCIRDCDIQATFWVLKKEMIRRVYPFTIAKQKGAKIEQRDVNSLPLRKG